MGRRIAKADVIPVRQQNQYNCVTTSLCMALRALGVPEDECSPARVNKVVGAMPLQGAAWEPMLAAANHYGMRATLTLPSTVRQLKSWTDAGKPVVIAWNPEGREWSHASLVFDVDDDLNVYVADPNIPDPDETVRVVSKKEFYSKWYEKAPQGFLIRRPACVIEREITPDGRQVMASRREAKELDTLWMVTEPTEDSEIIDILVGVSNWNTLRNIMVGSPDWRKRKPSFHDDLRSAKADAMDRLFRLWGREVPDWVMRSSQGDFRMASRRKTARVRRDDILGLETYEVAKTGRGSAALSLAPVVYALDDWEYIGEDGGVSVSWGQKSVLMDRRDFSAFAADMRKALQWAERYDYSKGRLASGSRKASARRVAGRHIGRKGDE